MALTKRLYIFTFLSILLLGLLGIIVLWNSTNKHRDDSQENSSKGAEQLFYDSLANAARQPRLRIAMYKASYTNANDAQKHQSATIETSSVAELDTSVGLMRSVYATNLSEPPDFDYGRCLDGKVYTDLTPSLDFPVSPQSLAEVKALLQNNTGLVPDTIGRTFTPCRQLGIVGGSHDSAYFRFSDGVFPVTISDTQASRWKEMVQVAELFTLQDEGTANYNGKKLRKISFSPTSKTVNKTLFEIFVEAAEIEKLRRDSPDSQYKYEFITINPQNSGNVGGYYLIDEATKLPSYSELYGADGVSVGNKQVIQKSRQHYSYPTALTLSLTSQLELLGPRL